MNFEKCIYPCKHHPNQNINHSHHPHKSVNLCKLRGSPLNQKAGKAAGLWPGCHRGSGKPLYSQELTLYWSLTTKNL